MPITNTKAYGTWASDKDLEVMNITRRELNADDVEIEILYCGVCHSDIHTARNDWGGAKYPVVPGHEIVGRVSSVGSNVSRFKVGDSVAVGCMVDSCRSCANCNDVLEQYCLNGFVGTYNGKDTHLGGHTLGGYSQTIIVQEHFVLRLPQSLNPAAAAPLLCAGITTWSPLRHWKVQQGSRVAVVGLGGLGHMAIKLAHALGATVSLFTRSASKKEEALALGASNIIISTEENEMQHAKNSFDLILDTVPYEHDLKPYLQTLNTNGTLVMLGFIGEFEQEAATTRPLISQRRAIAGSLIGGIAETQEMLDFCGQHNIVSEIELIPIQQINEAYERMIKSDVHYRFVIDMKSL